MTKTGLHPAQDLDVTQWTASFGQNGHHGATDRPEFCLPITRSIASFCLHTGYLLPISSCEMLEDSLGTPV